jgi:hypothetical protein
MSATLQKQLMTASLRFLSKADRNQERASLIVFAQHKHFSIILTIKNYQGKKQKA